MPKNNPTNPFSTDDNEIQRAAPMGVMRGTVEAVDGWDPDTEEGGYHTAWVRVYGDPSPYRATVLSPSRGDVNIPAEGDDVAIAFGPSMQPYILGYWYAANKVDDGRVDLPEHEPGERIIGTQHTSSYIKIEKSGRIEIVTEDDSPVDIDHQSASVYLDADQTGITDTGPPEIIEVDTVNHDPEGLFDASGNSLVLKHDGLYTVAGTTEVVSAGQNNTYTLYLYVNGTAIKHVSRQSTVNKPMSLAISTDRKLNSGDEITLRIDHDSGTRAVSGTSGEDIATEFSIKRVGI